MMLLLVLLGWLIGGRGGIVWAIVLGGISLLWGQQASSQLILRMYRARALHSQEAPQLYIEREKAQFQPQPYMSL